MKCSGTISSSRSSSSSCAPMGSCGAGTTTADVVVIGVVPPSPVIKRIWFFGHAYLAETIIEDCRLVRIVSGGLNGRLNSLVARNHERYLNPMHPRCHRPIVHHSVLGFKDFTFGNILQLDVHDL